MKFTEKQMLQLASLLATKEDVREVADKVDALEDGQKNLQKNISKLQTDTTKLQEDVTKLQTDVTRIDNTTHDFAGKIQDKMEEDLITKQHVTENREVITILADKAGVVTGF